MTRRQDGGRLLGAGVVALAFLLQGMILWRFVDVESVVGSRGLLVGAAVVLLHLVVALTRRPVAPRRALPPILALLGAVLVLVLSLARREPTDYGVWKTQSFVLFAFMPSVVVLWNLSGRQRAVGALFGWLLVFSFTPLLLPLLVVEELGTGPVRWLLTTVDVDVIGVGRTLGTGALLAFIAAAGRGRTASVLLAASGLALLAGQVVVGERGPLLALVAGLLVFVAAHARAGRPAVRRRPVLVVLGLLVAAVAAAFLFVGRAREGHPERRLDIARQGWDRLVESPVLGVGVGRFTYADGQLGERQYPHNVVGEVAVETGLAGLAVFALFFWLANRRVGARAAGDLARRNRNTAAALLAYSATAAMVSGDLATNSQVWVAQAVVFATGCGSGEEDRCASSS
jgi:hypothetical protein